MVFCPATDKLFLAAQLRNAVAGPYRELIAQLTRHLYLAFSTGSGVAVDLAKTQRTVDPLTVQWHAQF